ncbi:DUF4349 domain-containing protein [Micromonospora sp. CPCC 206060]|uniref:DUF4349 domain-containing protein n=1 Tax=Micromonospora sp. CPCC 206060 TaxID=3122406 RepID=UPI002FF0A848
MNVLRRHRPGLLLAVLGLAALVGVGACSSAPKSSSDSSAGGNSAAEAPAAAPADKQQAPEQAVPGGAGKPAAEAPRPDQRVDQRSIIYTGSLRVRVDDVDAAAADAIRIVTTAGGFVGGDRRSGGRIIGSGDNRGRSGPEADLELRVPAAKFTGVVDQLAGLGESLSREVNTQDVTEETVDLAARIATQRARVESGRRLLAQAKTLGELISLESEVAKREADLAALEAKQRRLADLTALSTITVEFREVAPPPPAEKEDEAGFLVGLKAGWRAFLDTSVVVLTVVGALLPWLVVLGVPLWVLFRWLRRRRAGRVAAPLAGRPAPVPATVGLPTPPVRPAEPGVPGQVAPAPRPPMTTEPPSSATPSGPGA